MSNKIRNFFMNFCAIICASNPTHNVHIYQMEQARKITGNNILCLMGGNFSQRGEPCLINKYQKTEIALNNGADMVLELPTVFATQSAQIFALASIKILNSIKNVTHLCFGAECDDLQLLNEIACYLIHPSSQFKNNFKQNLKKGYSYGLSIIKSLENKQYASILSKPNNVLAVEYLKALKQTKSKIIPVVIKREDNFNSTLPTQSFASATAIRNSFVNNNIEDFKKYIPNDCYEVLKTTNPLNLDIFNNIVKYKIQTNIDLRKIFLINEGVERYILLSDISTKRYSVNKLNRSKLNILLNIEKKTISKLYRHKKLPFIKVLGAKKESLKNIECSTVFIVRKNDITKKSKYFCELEQIENNANILYSMLSNTQLNKHSIYSKCQII